MEMPKEYSIEFEKEIQKKWEENKIYKFKNDEKRPPYIIDTPPPYPTGRMHLGHALNWTYMDIIARFKRMNGYDVLFPQGWDCHGLPTEVKVEEIHGITKSDIDRHEFRKLCVELTKENIEKMREQVKSLGISIDWDREYITMNPDYVKKSQTAFVRMYNKGLIYRGKHPVNWCPRCQTAIAFAEVDYKDRVSKLNYIKFPYSEDENKFLEIATSRPELLAACVGIVVHPEDERYKDVVGKTVKVPLFNQEVKVYPDKDVEKEFGTGVVMVCTFGDKTDVVWVNRHGLEVKKAINEKGELSEICGKYAGMKTEDARKQIIEDLKNEGYLIKQEPLEQNVGVCWRCKTPIEIIVGDQWFVNVKKLLPKVKQATDEIKWMPEHMKTRLLQWIEDMDWDWCISRQRLFATPIPVWYCPDCGEIIVAKEEDLPIDPTKECPYTCKCGNKNLIPETDVLDTWMDSSITPMVIAGWLDDDEFFKSHYPVQLRPQGHDIIRTWAFYTIIKSIALTDKKPWDEIVINGMVFGEDGYKMSKSRGNIVEPFEITKNYGSDALRLWAANSTLGNDVPFAWKEVDFGYRFLRKFWNASRFAKMNLDDETIDTIKNINITLNNPVDLWILSKLNRLIKKVSEDLNNYKFNTIVDIQKFVWHELCDNYIEMVKYRLYNKENTEKAKISKFNAQYTLYTVITNTLKLMAPFAPHFADVVGYIYKVDNLHTSWCVVDENLISEENEYIGELAKNTVASIRRYKSNKGMPLNTELRNVEIYVLDNNEYEGMLKVVEDIKGALNIKELNIINGKPELEQKIVEVIPNKSKIGPEFKKDSKKVMEFIKNADEGTIEKMLNEGIETEFGLLTKEHIKSVKRALFSKGEVVETVDIDGLIDGIAIIQ
ncbi:valine--tRNA ligase [Methanothermococcus okinawensis]|uniref:Valine--tRNA ligase n=1 Tax=Methanothermococcus okinawensis (strain DSM 14208 / JCM 11175 / IH1) TaxID=647113 RepID=F8AKC5_METOI|nr:valine--tRNA ligase [Methanothermococcus okinawensis]AEH06325.1 Valyl-tRNA synthetase [Methanothermococcus okinawensis IH1]